MMEEAGDPREPPALSGMKWSEVQVGMYVRCAEEHVLAAALARWEDAEEAWGAVAAA